MQTPSRIGKYELEEFLGGGMSHVYRATDTLIGRTVAVKILTPQGCADSDAKARFLAEAKMSGNIQHENIIRVYDYGEEAGRPYMVMEFLVGDNLKEALKKNALPTLAEKLRSASELASALEYVHSKGIIHRDIKPDNVHIDAGGKTKLMDFGIAKADGLSLTRTGFSLGTPYYMSPEQVLGKPVTERADIYSFGILLYEMFSGVRALSGDTVERIFYVILNEPLDLEPLRRSGVPQWLIGVITKCTAKNAGERYASFSEVRDSLARGMNHSAPPAKQPANSGAGKYLAAALLAIILAGAGGLIWMKRPQPARVYAPKLPTETGLMLLVPGGPAKTGPRNEPVVVPPFYIDRTEVTNWAYSKFCAATGRNLPAEFSQDRPDDPVVNVTYEDAAAFAKWAGKRLPDAIEWEKAARGGEGRQFPWGDAADPSRANVSDNPQSQRKALPSDSMAEGATPAGVLHLAGNVAEYVRNSITPSSLAIEHFASRLNPPPKPSEPWFSVKGGSFDHPLSEAEPWEWDPVPVRYAAANIGFRCAKDPPR